MTTPATPVVVFNRWGQRPVFHDVAPWQPAIELGGGWRRKEEMTVCGRTYHHLEWWNDPQGVGFDPFQPAVRNELDQGVVLRLDHARLIGRRCYRCAARQGFDL